MLSVLICTRLISNRFQCVLSLWHSLQSPWRAKIQSIKESRSAHTHILDWIDVVHFHFRFIIRSIANDVNFDYILYFNSRFDNIHGDESTYLLAAIARLIFYFRRFSVPFFSAIVYLFICHWPILWWVCVSRGARFLVAHAKRNSSRGWFDGSATWID